MARRGFRGGVKRRQAVERLIGRDGNWCWYCGISFAESKGDRACTIDHVMPRALGGPNSLGNLRLACQYCNGRRTRVVGYEHSEVLERRRWFAYRELMLTTATWLPKAAFHHPQITWINATRWSCASCGQDSLGGTRSPLVVPCSPWCDIPGARWEAWWHGERRAPRGWPNTGHGRRDRVRDPDYGAGDEQAKETPVPRHQQADTVGV